MVQRRTLVITLMLTGVALLAVVIWVVYQQVQDDRERTVAILEAVQAFVTMVATGLLAWVTWLYVSKTKAIASATRDAARAAEQQRLAAAQPVVVGRLRDATYAEDRTPIGPPVSIECELTNIGSGPALNLRARLTLPMLRGASDGITLEYDGVGPGFADVHALGAAPGTPALSGHFRLSDRYDGTIQFRSGPFEPGNTYQVELSITGTSIYDESFLTVARFWLYMGGTFIPPRSGPLEQAVPLEYRKINTHDAPA